MAASLLALLGQGAPSALEAAEEPAPVDLAAEGDEAPAERRTGAAGDAADADTDADEDSDADRPIRLTVSTDAACNVYLDDELVGRATPDKPLEVGVELGEVELRATSAEVPQAAWEKTLELDEAGAESVRVKMKRAIRQFRKEERKSGVYRDPRTSLMWPKRDNGRDVDLRAAYVYCRDLGTAGFDDWRLPTLEQLASLQAIWSRSTYKIQGEIALSECCVWSSEYDGSSRAKTYNYRFRKPFDTNAGYKIGLRALCVRDWDPDTEPEEGQEEDADEADETPD